MGTCKQPLPTVGSLDDARKSSSRRGEAGFSKNQLRTYARGKRVYVASAGGAQASPSCPREEWDRQWSREARAGEVLDSLSHRKIQPWGPKRCGSLAAVKVVRVTLSFHLLFFFFSAGDGTQDLRKPGLCSTRIMPPTPRWRC